MKMLLEPVTGHWILLAGPRGLNAMLLTAIARLGERGAVRVLDGGNRFDAYTVARQAYGRTVVLDRITVSRAFTCYQMLSLLERTPADPIPFVVMDMLRTFYDESIHIGERKRLLQGCIAQLNRLGKASGGMVSIYPPALLGPEVPSLWTLLQSAAAETLVIEPPRADPEPMRLF